jgi:hypothetical protein
MYTGGPPPTGYYAANSDGSLVGWWRLNETVPDAGGFIDVSGNGRDGTTTSGETPVFSSVLYPSKYIQTGSFTFDGTNDAINIGSAATWDAVIGNNTSSGSTEKMSFSAWVYKTGDGGGNYGEILDFGGTDIGFYTGATERIFLSAKWNGNNTVKWRTRDANPFPLNAWTHIVVTYDATDSSNDPEFYVNGTLVATEHSSGTKTGDYYGIVSQDGFIGNRSDGTYSWEGQLADVAIWNKVLSAADVAALYAAQAGPIYYTYRNYDLIGYGQRLSPSGSQYEMTLQGLDAQKDGIYYPSLLPRIRQGAPLSLWRNGDKLSDKYFDDTLSMNPNPNDMRSANDPKITQRINFEWEQLDFGQAPTTQQGTSYVETQRYDPVGYLQSSEETMWPVNLFNLGSLLDHEFDGVIEPLDIRAEVLGISDNRYEGHAVRGGLTGGAAETYFGSKQIVDVWKTSDAKVPHFLDAPINWGTIPIGAYSNITQEPDSLFRDTTAFDVTNGTLFLNNVQRNGVFQQVGADGSNYAYALSYPANKFSRSSPVRSHYFPIESPQLWVRMNESVANSGGFKDSSVFDRTTDTDDGETPTFDGGLSPSGYIQGGSCTFDGTDDGIHIGTHTLWNSIIGATGSEKMSFSIWVRYNSTQSNIYPRLYQFGDNWSTGKFIFAWIGASGRVRFEAGFANTDGQWYTSDFPIDTNNPTWTHIVITYSAVAAEIPTIYINGESWSVTTLAASAGDFDGIAGADCYIGRRDYSTIRAYAGQLADFVIWSSILSDEEVKALYNAKSGVYHDGLVDDPLISAMRLMNTGSQAGTDPTEERANHGFYFDKNAGSIIYGDW